MISLLVDFDAKWPNRIAIARGDRHARGQLDPKRLILIVCEGQNTEPQYLHGLARAHRNSRVHIEIAPEHGVPRTLVEVAKQRKLENENDAVRKRDQNLRYDAVWCVFDIDDHPAIFDAKQMARSNGIELAVSNPCFELWLLLHFRESPGMQTRGKIHKMLGSHVPGYDKRVDYATYSDGYENAVKRAERLDRSAESDGEPGRNPTTGVHKLTERIRAE